jgi:hypothetical protein
MWINTCNELSLHQRPPFSLIRFLLLSYDRLAYIIPNPRS